MFYYIKGPLAYSDPTCAVIEAGGVGYKMTVSGTTHDSLPTLNNTVKLYTHLSVREDGVELFGFKTLEELDCFKLLIGVSGVGPKVAISILSLLTPEKFTLVVSSEDSKALSKANGVGAKTAARIILELKDKLSAFDTSGSAAAISEVSTSAAKGGNLSDATEALIAIGYSRAEVMTALKGVDVSGMSVEEIFKAATKRLMRQ